MNNHVYTYLVKLSENSFTKLRTSPDLSRMSCYGWSSRAREQTHYKIWKRTNHRAHFVAIGENSNGRKREAGGDFAERPRSVDDVIDDDAVSTCVSACRPAT